MTTDATIKLMAKYALPTPYLMAEAVASDTTVEGWL